MKNDARRKRRDLLTNSENQFAYHIQFRSSKRFIMLFSLSVFILVARFLPISTSFFFLSAVCSAWLCVVVVFIFPFSLLAFYFSIFLIRFISSSYPHILGGAGELSRWQPAECSVPANGYYHWVFLYVHCTRFPFDAFYFILSKAE